MKLILAFFLLFFLCLKPQSSFALTFKDCSFIHSPYLDFAFQELPLDQEIIQTLEKRLSSDRRILYWEASKIPYTVSVSLLVFSKIANRVDQVKVECFYNRERAPSGWDATIFPHVAVETSMREGGNFLTALSVFFTIPDSQSMNTSNTPLFYSKHFERGEIVALPRKTQIFIKSSDHVLRPILALDPRINKESLPFSKLGENEALAKPILSSTAIQMIFDPSRRVRFSVIWNQNTFDPAATSFEELEKLAQHKIFALAFASLYLFDRDLLDRQASRVLKADEDFVIEIYFQRARAALDRFGDEGDQQHSQRRFTEQGCLNDFKLAMKSGTFDRRTPYGSAFCAPQINITLKKVKHSDQSEISRVLLYEDPFNLLYGPGTGRELLDIQTVVKKMR
jgi:hypothetical protein